MATPALLKELIIEKLDNTPAKAITGRGYEELIHKFDLTGKVSISKFRKALGSLNFSDRKIKVEYSERNGINDIEPRDITVTLLRR